MRPAVQVSELLRAQGIAATVVDPVWALPVNDALVELADQHELVVTIEDNLVIGGLGSRLETGDGRRRGRCRCGSSASRSATWTPLPREVLAEIGLTPQSVARQVIATVSRLDEPSTEQLDHERSN